MRRRDFIKSICSATVALALVPTVAMGQPTQRTITLINECTFPVFPGATSGGFSSPPTACQTGNTCGIGQVCNPANRQCYWKPLMTTTGQALDAFTLKLSPLGETGSTAQVTIPILSTGTMDTIWSGNIWAGTDFPPGSSPRKAGIAATGYCATSSSTGWTVIACDAFTGSQNAPLTKAEFALVNSTDFYDISAIHGANVPISMEPTAGQKFGPVPAGSANQKTYWCTAPGRVSTTALCDWVFKPPTNNVINNPPGLALVQHQQMDSARIACGGPNQTCPSGQVCGLAFDSSKGTSGLYQECGNNNAMGGTWSAIQICTAIGYNNNNLNPNQVSTQFINSLNCGTGPDSAGNAQLFQCNPPNKTSCYDSTATAACCGCPNWPVTYKPNVTNKSGNAKATNACYSTNPNWTSVSGAWLTYIKQACPAAYSYQYDDVTSTFTCTATVPNTTINATNYTITFCPDHLLARVSQQP